MTTAKHRMDGGKVYFVKTAARPEGFRFQCLGAGTGGATGYMDESASWPRSVRFDEITHLEESSGR